MPPRRGDARGRCRVARVSRDRPLVKGQGVHLEVVGDFAHGGWLYKRWSGGLSSASSLPLPRTL
jgi:hypothetical protein